MGESKSRESEFHFRHFSVADNAGAMKIGTDGVLLGAWCSVKPGAIVWDAGCGTALIALMTMQRGAGRAVGFEINEAAAAEASRNVAASPWAGKIRIERGDFATLAENETCRPDLIVSNPPFFTEHLKSPDAVRAIARHEGDALSFRTLLRVAAEYLSPGGSLCVVSPAERLAELEFEGDLARMHIRRILRIATVEGKQPKRVLIEWQHELPPTVERAMLTLRLRDGSITPEYRELTNNFYIKLS